ncbi:MAG: NTP transferase domain-containing protein [Akkermansiaceae bacterium]|nr:NTP transferase domain-containing protein [Akkermansiaceae bacterium]
MTTPRPLHGLVLAGGRSARMGTDKAALVHPDGRPLARRTLDLLAAADCAQVLVSLRHDQPVPPQIPASPATGIVRDPDGGSCGPLAGILAAMRLHPEADWLVAACDLPRLDLATLRHLTASRLPDDMFLAYRSEFDGLPEPLCAFYAAAALPILQQAADDGLRCPRKILIRHHCRLLDPPVPRALENANTAADWQTAQCP